MLTSRSPSAAVYRDVSAGPICIKIQEVATEEQRRKREPGELMGPRGVRETLRMGALLAVLRAEKVATRSSYAQADCS